MVVPAKTLPRPIMRGHHPAKIFASPDNFKLSTSSLSQTSRNLSNSPDIIRNHFKHLSTYRYKLHSFSVSSNTSEESELASKKSPKHEDHFYYRGIKRSRAFHTAELLEQQVMYHFKGDKSPLYPY